VQLPDRQPRPAGNRESDQGPSRGESVRKGTRELSRPRIYFSIGLPTTPRLDSTCPRRLRIQFLPKPVRALDARICVVVTLAIPFPVVYYIRLSLLHLVDHKATRHPAHLYCPLCTLFLATSTTSKGYHPGEAIGSGAHYNKTRHVRVLTED
jgi:hypothetical protein